MDDVSTLLDRLRLDYAAVCPVTADMLFSEPDRLMLGSGAALPPPIVP